MTFAAFFERVRAAAEQLGAPDMSALVAAIQQQTGSPRLRLLVVGAPGSGRFSLVNLLLSQPDLLPASPLPRLPLALTLRHGSSITAEVTASDGLTTALAPGKVRALLTNPAAEAASYQRLDLNAPADLLRTSDIRIESIVPGRSDAAWKEILAGSDYTLLVLNAVALLSEHERRFVRDLLQPVFGLERVAVIINQMDLVEEAERSSIIEHVRGFLGPFERQPVLLPLSVVQVWQAIQSRSVPVTSGFVRLRRLVYEDLQEQHRSLKTSTLAQAARLCLDTLRAEVQRQQALLVTSQADLQQTLDRLDPDSPRVQERIGRVQQRIEAFINTLVKEQSLREVEAFSLVLREQLPAELQAIDDSYTIKKHLPGYVETIWSEFFRAHLTPLRAALTEELHDISTIIEHDLRELLEQTPADLRDALLQFNPTPASMKAFLMPSRGKNPLGAAATWMQVGGLFFLVLNPQISLALIGGGQLVRMIFQRSITESDKQAIIGSLSETIYDLERQVKFQVTQRFNTLSDELKQAAADTYTGTITRMRSELQAQIARQSELALQAETITRLAEETVPALQHHLDRLMETHL